MPILSRYFIRSALIYLGIGLTFGGLMLSAKGGVVSVQVWVWLPMHIVLLMDGWLLQLSLGVGYWILPRIKVHVRGRRGWAWVGFAAMQVGLALTLLTTLKPWLPTVQGLFTPAFILQVIGVFCFSVHAWPRIRPTFVRAASAFNRQAARE